VPPSPISTTSKQPAQTEKSALAASETSTLEIVREEGGGGKF
jgi:hypothetical protein